MNGRRDQRGAALLIVLLLAATMGFIAFSITEKTALAAARAANAQQRTELFWNAIGAEALAAAAMSDTLAAAGGKMSIDDPWAAEPTEIPLETGRARIFFADNTVCFNVNSLEGGVNAVLTPTDTMQELSRLLGHLGLGEFEAEQIVHVITDWIDPDLSRLPQGAEDEYYTVLPSPYRAGNGPISSVTEIRAMRGMTRDVYAGLKPFLCAHPDAMPSRININFASASDAPVIAAAIGEGFTVAAAADLIAARPPGGYTDVQAFLSDPAFANLPNPPDANRFDIRSKYLQARAEILYDPAILEVTVDFAVGENNAVKAFGRRLGAEE